MPAFLPTPPALLQISAPSPSPSPSSNTPRRPRHPSMSVQRINNPTDFAAALPLPHTNPLSPLVVFSFITRGCRACNYASNAYRRLANDFALQSPHRQIRFCEMDISEQQNHTLGQRLGVNAVPALQVYAFKGDHNRGGVGVLDEAVGPRMVDKVRKKLDVYLSDSFDLDEYVFEDAYK